VPASYRNKFSDKYEHRLIEGGIGHNPPQEAPQAFAQAIVDVENGRPNAPSMALDYKLLTYAGIRPLSRVCLQAMPGSASPADENSWWPRTAVARQLAVLLA
jgi:hypothetical protein